MDNQRVFDFQKKTDKKVVDLRSDTCSRAPQQMLKYMVEADVGDDVFDDDPATKQFQKKVAEMFGKQAALFTPSATMSNLIAAVLSANPGDQVIVWGKSHFADREAANLAVIGGLQTRQIQSKNGLFNLKQIEKKYRPSEFVVYPKTSLIFLQNPTFTGNIWNLQQLSKIKSFAEEKHLKVHIDGARIFNALCLYKMKPSDIGQYCDSLTLCLSKGLCCPSGSVLLGNKQFIKNAIKMRKRLGGGLRQTGMLAAAGLYSLQHIYPQVIQRDNDLAYLTAKKLKQIPEVVVNLEQVQINMVNFSFNKEIGHDKYLKFMKENEILMKGFNPEKQAYRIVIHRVIQKEDCQKFVNLTRSFLQNH